MKKEQFLDDTKFSHDQEKPLSQIKCIKGKLATKLCTDSNCQKHAFACEDQQCQCNQHHSLCSLLFIKNLIRVLNKKIITLKPIEKKIQSEFDKIIDKISQYKEQLIKKCQQTFDKFFGLQPFQAQFLKSIENKQVNDIRGKDTLKIQMNLKSLSKGGKHYDKLQDRISQAIEDFIKKGEEFNLKIQTIIEQFTNLKMHFTDSSLIKTAKQIDTIQGFFSQKSIKQSKLLYRASQHNFAVSKFHQKCDGKNHIFIVCETQFGKIIGAYTPLTWNSSASWVVDHTQTSFLYSLTKNIKFKQVNKTNTMLLQSCDGPYFGSSSDLYIPDQANTSNCKATFSSNFLNSNYPGNNQNTNLQVLGSVNNTFKAKQWEVYQLEFQ